MGQPGLGSGRTLGHQAGGKITPGLGVMAPDKRLTFNNPMDKLISVIVTASEAWVRSGAQAVSSAPRSVMTQWGKELGGKGM